MSTQIEVLQKQIQDEANALGEQLTECSDALPKVRFRIIADYAIS
jgi:hypothetical protein